MGKLDSGFSGRSLPFFSLPNSSIIKGTASVEEALVLAGLDWEVEKVPAGHMVDGVFEEVSGKFVTRRMDTLDPLGIVGSVYGVFNNRPAFEFADHLLDGGAEFEAAGSYNGGANTFLVAELPEGIKVQGEEDMSLFLQMHNSHDGSGTVAWYATPVRITCTNISRFAISQAVSSAKIRHTRSTADRVAQAAEALNLVNIYKRDLEDGIKVLQETEMELDEVTNFFAALTSSDRVRANLTTTYQNSPTVDRGTQWGVLNSVTETLQFAPGRNTGAESRFSSNLDGVNQRTVERATRMLIRR